MSSIPMSWGDGEPVSREDRLKIQALRKAGCPCPFPLLGERPGGIVRCRICNRETEAQVKG